MNTYSEGESLTNLENLKTLEKLMKGLYNGEEEEGIVREGSKNKKKKVIKKEREVESVKKYIIRGVKKVRGKKKEEEFVCSLTGKENRVGNNGMKAEGNEEWREKLRTKRHHTYFEAPWEEEC